MEKHEEKSLFHWYLQYSKRIAVFGIIQWAIIAVVAIALVWVMSLLRLEPVQTIISLATNIITSSSALAIATSSGYYAHSAYDKKLQKRVEQAILPGDDEEAEEDGAEKGNG